MVAELASGRVEQSRLNEAPTRRSSESEPADSARDKSNASGGWLRSLTLPLGNMSHEPSRPIPAGLVLGLILALCLLLVWFFVLPRLAGSNKAKVPQVVGNLKQIDLAKQFWASDHAATNGAAVTEQDLMGYLRVPGSTGLLASVDSEIYRLNAVGTPPEAQLQRAFGSRFPKGTLIRWTTNAGCEILLPNNPVQGGANGWQPLYSLTNRMPAAAAPRRSP